jgi:hypothetical protein
MVKALMLLLDQGVPSCFGKLSFWQAPKLSKKKKKKKKKTPNPPHQKKKKKKKKKKNTYNKKCLS